MRMLRPACVCVAGIVFHAAAASAAAPEWITGFSSAYPAEGWLIGVGVSDEDGPRSEKQSVARSRAREEIAKQIRVRISARLSDFAAEAAGGGDSVSHSVIRNISRSSVDLEIEGIETPKTWYDERNEIEYALALLHRAKAGGLAVDRIDGLVRDARRELDQASLVQEDSAPEALRCCFRAKALLIRAQRHEGIAKVLGAERTCGEDEPELVEVLGRIDRLVARDETRGLNAAVTALAYRVTRAIDPELKILVDRFTYRDTKFAGPFSLFLTQGLDAKLAMVGGGKVVDKGRAARAVRVHAAADDPNAPEAFGRAAEADAVLYGNYQELGDEVIVRAHLSGIDGERLSSAEMTVSRKLVEDARLDLVPANYKQLQEELSYLGSPEDLGPKGLHIRVWTDRGDGGVYRGGERMYVYLKATKDCYVRLVYHQADATNIQVFPNTWAENRKIRAGKAYRIPEETDRFEFSICEPFGGEVLKAFASTQPFPEMGGRELDSGLRIFSETTRDLTRRMRGIAVQEKSAETAEAMCQITTVAPQM
jgi:hypothetical protein